MSKDTVKNCADEPAQNGNDEAVYQAPEVFVVGSAKKLLQGPMIQPYMDSPGSGYTQFRLDR